jgi:F-type H+-transporting ATPase subunit epsilon
MATSVEQQAQISASGGVLTVGGTTDMSFHPEREANRLRVVIVTPERAVLDDRAEFVVLPMVDGELGVLPQHAPLIGRIGKGDLRITKSGVVTRWNIAGGFAQVRKDVVTVLTEKAAVDASAPQE